ncbi:helix-turn-helix transcriptional regulator [Microbacterium sp. Leaf288]|uniref:helix-turn-helix transcriptional regulator n=1 Tax=Microbacterium sp. Leaf288 TaxID=1736323 RepID=UPI000A5C8378|nr:MerR family transcriptional regulator [Microbacterium sp. Leaf288]
MNRTQISPVIDSEEESDATNNDVPDHLECLFYSESEAADRLGLHRTTLRALALQGRAPIEPIHLTEHRRVYRRIDIHRLAGIEP